MNVISHNISAMNAQRQFGINTNNKAKTAENLSSGYRINRASDDAAGLSISEKMRRQIRGLTQGVENTEAGVSLCQVADGALAEVNDMLHRITELSVKSANGTNSESDRRAIQEEINQILEEIDRIEDTTTFNDHKIFKSSGVGTGGGANTSVSESVVSNVGCSGTPTDTSISKYTFDANATGLVINGQNIAWTNVKATNGDTMDSLKPNTYSATMNGLKFSFTINDGATMDSVTNALKDVSVDVSTSLGTPVESVGGISGYVPGMNSKSDYFNLVQTNHQITTDDTGITWNGQTINWTDKSTSHLYYTIEECIQNGIDFGIRFANGPSMNISVNTNATLDGVKAALNGATFDIENTGTVGYSTSSWSDEPNYDFDITQNALNDNVWTALGYDLYDTFETTPIESGINIDTNDLSNVKATFSNATNTVEFDLDSASKSKLQEIINNGGTAKANEEISLWFRYGNSTVIYEVTPMTDTPLTDVLDALKNKVEAEVDIPYAKTNLEVTNLRVNDISQGNIGNAPTIYNFDITQPNPVINQGGTSSSNADAKWCIWIQSGCDAGDGIPLEIDRMNTTILGIKDVNVMSIEGAEKAMTAVDDALKKLSANRSKIGAQQNRLEHTITNEDNIIENTTSAESRIRDADMAEEMVKFSKENILTQVGQSMLAQANQSTSGILNLLQ